MYFYGVKYNKRITHYSPTFETITEAVSWYNRKGINLIKMFGRELVLCKK